MTAQEDMKRPSENGAPDNKRPSEKTRTGKSPVRRLLKTVLWSSVLLSASSAGFLYWLAATESGLRFGLYTLPELGGVKISSKTLKGTLWHGFSGEDWRIETPSADLTVSSLGLQWQPQELFSDGLLHIRHLSVGDLHITTKPTPPKEERPAALPESISLPLAVKLDKLSVGKISSGKAGNTFLLHAEAAYDYDHKRHKLILNSLQTPWSSTGGELEIQTASPFALQGSIRGGAELEGITGGGEILLSGDLRRTAFKADLVGGKVSLKAEGLVGPFENSLDEQIDHILIKGHALNLAEFVPSAPQTDLDFDATIVPSPQKGLALEGSIDLANSLAAPADQNGIPVRSILGEFTVGDSGILKVHDVTATLLEEGALILGGETDTDKNTFALEAILKNASLSDFVSQKYDDVFEGSLLLNGTYREPQAKWDIRGNRASSTGELAIANDTANGQRTLNIAKASLLPKDGGELDIKGKLELFNDRLLEAEATSKNFNPGKLHPDFPTGSINGDIKLNGVLTEEKFSGKMQFGNSVLSGAVLSGNADVLYEKQHLARAAADIRLGRNRVKTDGSFGKAGDRLNLDINAPELDKFGFGLGGALTAKGFLAGEPKSISADLSGSVRNLRVKQAVNIRELDFKAAASPDYSRPLNLQINGRELVIPGSSGESTRIDTVNAAVSGTGMRHSIRSSGSMAMGGKNYTLDLEADGGLDKENRWKGTVGRLDLSGGFNLKLQNRMSLEAGAERVALGAAQWSAMGGRLNLNSFVWDKKNGLTSKGTAANLNVAELESFFKMPVEHNLVLSADWDLAYSQNARGFLNVRQQSGDIVLPYRKQALGLNGLTLQTRFQNGRIDNQINGKTRYGNIGGNVGISQQFGHSIMQAPVSGNLKIDIPDLAALKNLMPVGQSISGSLNAEATIGGRVGEPQLGGSLNGDNLYYVNRDLGVILDNGSLRSRLSGQQWQIQSLLFKRGNGNINLSGTVGWGGGVPAVDVNAVFDKYGILDKPRRRLTASGNTHFRYSYKNGIILDGSLKVDEGNFGFQKSGMPELDDDVVVLGEPKKETRDSVPFSMDIDLDLNDKVFFRGEGVDVTLGGRLKLTAQPKQDIQAVGTVAVVKGKYKAYGQDLNITKGTVSFVGPLSRPNLNIRAVRNLSPVGAGVEVLGNLENPRVTLVTNEPMSEKDKLSWLILNRASSGSDGDEAALSTAASAFLAGKLNDRIGLVDDFGLTSKRSRNAQTGELNPAEQVLTVGKQLSSELYLGYEFGLTSASQTVKLVYQLTRTIQAIVRVGSQSSGGEIKYVIRFD
ncbi:translocation/assembly module TamB domain-containing protein [Neisseria elongata]|uniref:translocation/assembly module TamB domain-containing protein n=1 Tax=Neisseria elongata TaxID=495 RepID=UPI0024B1770F|nr:translocation/assembly module TamB domain-containing protein [Neisseria elongata]